MVLARRTLLLLGPLIIGSLGACLYDMNRVWPDDGATNDQGGDQREDQDDSRPCPIVGFAPPVEVPQISSSSDDWGPFLAADGLSVLFTSWRKDGGKGKGDIWRSTRSDTMADFSEPTPIDEVNTASNEGGVVLSFDGLTLLFSSDRDGGKGDTDIWIATRSTTSAPFSAPKNLSEVNSNELDAPSFLSPDGQRLYLISGREGTGWHTIFVAERSDASQPFSTPTKIAELDAPKGHEHGGGLTWDELQVFVTSRRSGGKGGYDIWTARRQDRRETFPPLTNLADLNTANDDGSISITADGSLAMLSYDTCFAAGCSKEEANLWQTTSIRSCR